MYHKYDQYDIHILFRCESLIFDRIDFVRLDHFLLKEILYINHRQANDVEYKSLVRQRRRRSARKH